MSIRWKPVLEHAAEIVGSYDTGVTLRQLFYRLVADETLPNLQTYYRRLSGYSAEARREGTFPDLLDRTSRIEVPTAWTSPDAAREDLRNWYRRPRTEGQTWTIVLGVEKAGMSEQLDAWFTDPFGIPHVALGGFASQTLCDDVRRYVEEQDRLSVLVYAGDHDPSGEFMLEDFERRVGVFDKVVRIALNAEQTAGLPYNPDPKVEDKLKRDPRASAFIRRFEHLVQYELDALDPDDLRNLYRVAIDDVWDEETYQAVLDREERERAEL